MSVAAAPASARLARPADKIRVFVIDDSNVVRMIYSRVIGGEPGFEVAGVAGSAEEALAQIGSLHLHVILLDLEMPGMGGMRALPEIIRRCGTAKVLVVSSLTAAGAEKTIEALSLGAADTLQKPDAGSFDQAYRDRLIEKIRALSYRPLAREAASNTSGPLVLSPTPAHFSARIVAIGASTGGIQATGMVLSLLPAELGIPIVITQHLPPEFSQAYARQIADVTGRRTVVASSNTALVPDEIVLAPGDAHVCIDARGGEFITRLDRQSALSGCMPSVDTMFASLARSCGPNALGVCLTGMGRDGVVGARQLVEAGGCVLAQNESSSVVWGMPGAIAKAGLAAAVLHPCDIAARIAQSAKPSC